MTMVLALAVIGKDVDDLAALDPPMGATFDHTLQFGLKRLEAGDLLLDLDQLGPGDNVGFAA